MNRRLPLLALLLLPAAAAAQVPPEKALATFQVADGMELSLWAHEPLFVNPTCMDIDHQGRVWVCESVNYRCKLRNKPLNRAEGDRIVILEDSKGTGRADKATTFYQSPELLAPLGIAVAKDPVGPGWKVYVCQSPDILLFEDKDGDGKADGPPKKLLSGFKGYDHDHGVHGILIGPDLKLYFSVGDQGVDGLKDKNGKVWKSNSTDCRAGTIWRCDLDGQNLELLAHNFRNEYEPCVDSFGTIFVSDNDDDGNQQTRICYVMPGGNYGYHPRGPGQSHWHEEQPGVVPKILRTYFGSPTGMCVYEGTLLPKKYHGQLLHTDAGPRDLRCYHLTPDGAGYKVEQENLVQSSDNWFRPSDVCVAPDGSVFLADWYDPGVGGHGMGDTTRGRIYRLAPKGNKPSVPKVDLESPDGLVTALGSPALSVRYMAMAKVRVEKKKFLEPKYLNKLLTASQKDREQPSLRARVLWQMGALLGKEDNGLEVLEIFGSVAETLKDPDPRFRCLALRIFKEAWGESPISLIVRDETRDMLGKLLTDPSPAVRRELLLALRDDVLDQNKPLLYELTRRYDGKDRFYLCAIGIAVGHHDKARRDVILADFEKHFPKWNDQVADLVWELRPPQVLAKLDQRVADVKLPAAQRARVIDILAAGEDAASGRALLKLLQADVPPEVRERIFANLKLFLPGKWRELRGGAEVADAYKNLLKKPETRAAGLGLIAAADRGDALALVKDIAGDEKEALPVRTAAVQALGALNSAQAAAALDALLKSGPVPLRAEAAHALAGHLEKRKDTPEGRAALKMLQDVVTAKDQELPVRLAAVAALATTQPGSDWLLDLHAQKKLADDVKADAARLLRNSPFKGVQNKALLAFPPPAKIDPAKIPPIAALVARRGDAGRGKQLLAATLKNDLQCLKCHTVRGVGGSIGPDLSVIGKKAGKDNLFESILYPSKAVADQYVNWVVTTKKGLTLTGLVVEDTPAGIVLRDANGTDHKIAQNDIDERSKSPVSLMPENLLGYMTEDDLVDMVAYLLTLKTPALAVDSWHVAGPFPGGADALEKDFGPEKGVDLAATYPGKAGKVGWRVLKPNQQGYADLSAFFGKDGDNAVSYVYRVIESPADQEAEVLLGTGGAARLWVNGEAVHTTRAPRTAAPEQDRVKVRLKKGANPVLLKVAGGEGPQGFFLTVLAEQELKAGK